LDQPAIPVFKPCGLPCLIGSLPLTDHREAVQWVMEYVPEIPLWPQLPKYPQEGMLLQFIEGFPGVTLQDDHLFLNGAASNFEQELLEFYDEFLKVNEDPFLLAGSRFGLSINRANGIYALKEAISDHKGAKAIKGQVTGPFTLLTGITDQNKRLSYYDPTLRDMMVKGLALKAAWQVRFFAEYGLPVLLFIDEPALAGLGSSSFISISNQDVAADLSEIIAAIHTAGGLAGIHICSNTDWGFVLSLDLDILSFDAYNFFDRFLMFKPQVHAFLERGKVIAWGLIPTGDEQAINNEGVDSLADKWESQAKALSSSRWDLPSLLTQTMITPSCGTGSLSLTTARRVLALTRGVAASLRGKIF